MRSVSAYIRTDVSTQDACCDSAAARRWSKIAECVRSRLRDSQRRPFSGVSCDFREGAITLRGQVATFYLKQIAQELAAKVDGVKVVVNAIEVVEAPSQNAPTAQAMGASVEIDPIKYG